MSTITITPIDRMSQPKDFKNKFVLFPWKIYKQGPFKDTSWAKAWCPPLIMDMMDRFRPSYNVHLKRTQIQAFIAERDGEVVGRITASISQGHLDKFKDATGHFGWFECIDDQDVANELFNAASNWLKGKGMKRITGPFSFSILEMLGMKCDSAPGFPAGYEEMPMVMMPHNPPYYNRLVANYGFTKAQDLYSYHLDMVKGLSDRVHRVAKISVERIQRQFGEVTYREIDLKYWDREVALVKDIYNDAWEDNWGQFPWTQEELDHEGKDLKMLVEKKLVHFVFVNGEVAGVVLAVPDMHQVQKSIDGKLFPFGLIKVLLGLKVFKSYNRSRCMVMGIKKKFQHKGLEAGLIERVFQGGKKLGIIDGELSWILESNIRMRNQVEPFADRVWMSYRIYEKGI